MSYFDLESGKEAFKQQVSKGLEPKAPREVPKEPGTNPSIDRSNSDPDKDIPIILKGKSYIFIALFQLILTIESPNIQSENLESSLDVVLDISPVEVSK